MSKRITLKRGESFKKIHAFVKKQRNKSFEKLAKEREQRSSEHEGELERLKVAQDVVPQVNSFSFGYHDDHDMGDTPVYQGTSTRETWERYTIEELVTLYVSSLAEGKPNLALTDPQQGQYTCQCTDKRTKSVTLYMMCGKLLA
jgi:hypothetical protein